MKQIIRTSDRRAFKACRRMWNWSSRLREGLSPLIVPKPLEFGTAWHAAMAVYYDPSTWRFLKSPERAFAVEEAAIQAFLDETWKQQNRHENIDVELEEDYDARRELGVGMLRHYFKWAPTMDDFTPVKAEIEFEVPIYDDVVYQGRIDGIVQDPQGWYWILEHKTTAQFGDMTHLSLDEQLTSYGWALREIGITVRGAIYSEALKAVPNPPKMLQSQREGRWFSVNKMQRTTYDLYRDTLIAANEPLHRYQEFLDHLRDEPNPFFRRYEQHRTSAEYDEIGQRISMEAVDMLNSDLPLYPNPGRFNCSFCVFKEPCLTMNQGHDYEFILRELFVRREEDKLEASTDENGAGTI